MQSTSNQHKIDLKKDIFIKKNGVWTSISKELSQDDISLMILISFAEEEEEEAEEAVEPQSIPPDLESYEARAERVLEEQRERVSIAPELDYIDEEDEDVQPQVIKRIGLSLQKFLKRYPQFKRGPHTYNEG